MGLYSFDSRLSCAHFRLYCNSIMGLNNFEHGQKNLMMGYYSFRNELVNNTLWTYVLPILACPMGKLF